MSTSLSNWVAGQLERSVEGLLRSVSALGLVQVRAAFGQRIVPRRGSVLASPVPANYDPEPDYFFHWFRDAALVMDALRQIPASLLPAQAALGYFTDFVAFNTEIARLDGSAVQGAALATIDPSHRAHLRSPEELARIRGTALLGDVRVNPDATLDILRWARPQHDGPALRALCLLQWLARAGLPEAVRDAAAQLLESDLAYLREHAATPGYDVWEEELAQHFHTRATAATALSRGASWLAARGRRPGAHPGTQARAVVRATRAAAAALWRALDEHWSVEKGFILSRLPPSPEEPTRELDMSVILAALAIGPHGPFGIRDERVHATLARLARLFQALYPINHGAPSGRAAALGRYAGDRYFGGNPWYVTTLAAAELCYRCAAASGAEMSRARRARGDAWLETVRAYTPADGALAEQFDRASGTPRSARDLAWSHAAFISCAAARDATA